MAPTAPAVPFAAFSHLIEVPDTGKTAAVLRAARESLGDGRLLIVDDAHLLDKLSAALVYQLAVSRAVRLIVTSRRRSAPEAIAALWRDDLLARIDVAPPGHDDSRLDALGRGVRRGAARPRRTGCWSIWPSRIRCRSADRPALAGRRRRHRCRGDGRGRRRRRPRAVRRIRCSSTRSATRWRGPELRRLRTELVDRLAASSPRGVVDRLRLAALALDSDTPAAGGRLWPPRPRRRCGWATWSSANGSAGRHCERSRSWRRG